MPCTLTPRDELQRAIDQAGGKTALLRKLNDRGHDIKSHNVITQWLESDRTPAKYCPDIEAICEGILCERLNPEVNWSVLRQQDSEQRGV